MKNFFRKNKKAMSLIEAILAIGIFALGIQVFSLVFIKIWKANSFIVQEGEVSLVASRTISETVRNLRKIRQADDGSFPIKSGDAYNLTVFFDFDNDGTTERVHYFLENEEFKLGLTKPSETPIVYPAGDQEIRVLTSSVVNNLLGEPIFSYYNKNYPGDLSNNPLPIPLDVSNARLVRIHLFVNTNPNKNSDYVSIESMVEFRNINDYAQY